MSSIQVFDDLAGFSAPAGFEAAGISCDVRGKNNQRLDLALIYSTLPCSAAGTFTRNAVKAAPVRICKQVLAAGADVRGIVANSGNANSCTGEQGMADARRMAAEAARACGAAPESFLVGSTGRIGEPLPMDRIVGGIVRAAAEKAAGLDGWQRAAEAILTSDTRAKVVTAKLAFGGQTVTVSGIAKGAGMIQPNMATMLAYLVTDAAVSGPFLRETLVAAVNSSFNCITVDGDMSTNDTVLLLANGAAGVEVSEASPPDVRQGFAEAVRRCAEVLAEKIVSDGEKITKVVELVVTGADSASDAEKVARAIGNSLLVKSSWFGEDPNWGRLADAAGYAGARLCEEKLEIHYGTVPAMLGGRGLPENKPRWKEVVRARRFSITLNLNLGSGRYRLLATDLTEGYVNYNKSE